MTLAELGKALGVQLKGDPEYRIDRVRDIERLAPEAELAENAVYFIETPAVHKRHPKAAERGALLVPAALAERFPRCLIAPDGDARLVFIALLKLFDKSPCFKPGIAAGARVHPSAAVDPTACVLDGAVVMEGARVGARAVLYPGAVIEPRAAVGADSVIHSCSVVGYDCAVGERCILHGGTVLGADGFGFYDRPGGRYKIPQIGNVVIGDDVEIGASCTIDRAAIESTTVGAFTKIDDQVHIGHNCQVGRYVYIVGNSAIGGSVVIEDGAMISGMVIIKDHLRIAKGSIVMGMSGVAQDTEPGQAFFGSPARPARQMHKMNAALERLPELLVAMRREKDRTPAA